MTLDQLINASNIFYYKRGEVVTLDRLSAHMELAKTSGQEITMPRIHVNGREGFIVDVRKMTNGAWTIRILEKGKTYYQNFYKGETLRSDGYALHSNSTCDVITAEEFWEKFHGPRGDKAPAYVFFNNHKYRMPSFAKIYGLDGVLVTLVSNSGVKYLIQVDENLGGEFVRFGNTWSINNGKSLERVEVLER